MHFILDANEENYVFEANSCQSLINIFKHFNSIHSSNVKTKELFASFFEYLHVLHPENKAYIVYATKHFYFNLTICLPSVKSLQEYKGIDVLVEEADKEAHEEVVPIEAVQQEERTFKRQLINLDRFQMNENEKNFSQISASLMEIMYDMIMVLPDYLINEILNLLKYESFIMFAMVI